MTSPQSYSVAESSPVLKPQIQAIQSIMPCNITEPRTARSISIENGHVSGVFQKHLNMVFYYHKCPDQDYSGWLVAGWIKESLCRALTEQPLLCGLLRRRDAGEGKMDIVSNDSGVRLVEAKMPAALSAWMEMKGTEEADSELVYWEDVDEDNPYFSPLSFVQVTSFECGGYSIGISCSLLLADFILFTDFLQHWRTVHNNMVARKGGLELPTFYYPVLKPGIPHASIANSGAGQQLGRTMNFKMATENVENVGVDESLCKKLAVMCIEEAEKKHGCNAAPRFTFLFKEPSGAVKVQEQLKGGAAGPPMLVGEQVAESTVEALGLDELVFWEDNKPACTSVWVAPVSDGVVVAVPCSDSNSTSQLKMLVSLPCEQAIQ